MRPLANRLGALLLGLALLGLGGLAVIECIAVGAAGRFLWIPGRAWLRTLRTTPWSDQVVIGTAAFAGLVGLVGLVLELTPRRQQTVEVRASRRIDRSAPLGWLAGIRWEVERRSLEGALSSWLNGHVPGERYVTRLKGHGRRVELKVAARSPGVTPDEVVAAARAQLVRLTGQDAVAVSVKVRRPVRLEDDVDGDAPSRADPIGGGDPGADPVAARRPIALSGGERP